jgi:hypothetical protein
LREKQEPRSELPRKPARKKPARRSKSGEIRDPVVTAIAIDGGLDSHEFEALQLELRALASACGLEITALEIAAPAAKAAKRG